MISNYKTLIILAFLLCCTALLPQYGEAAGEIKREFRGAWIQCVNGQFQGLGRDNMQRTLSYQLDELKKDGVNAIIFQVRPECDALYESRYEPWSRFLTGQQGVAPSPYWDPLQWMIDECHKRGMELHAWINPFRAKTKVTTNLAGSHIAARRPDLVFPYDGLSILNPARPENRTYICQISADIIRRYDVDGFHIDDYFYPYPVAGCVIPDQADFQSNPRGFANINDWRRNNVDLFIKELHDTIQAVKPWVKFGVSPFGIYHNQRNQVMAVDQNGRRTGEYVPGSNTTGLQNYDDLYADVLLWVNKGWIDYCVPQLYWEIGHKAADYETLIHWWTENCTNRPLYIGEDIERTINHGQQDRKYQLYMQLANSQGTNTNRYGKKSSLDGTVLWYAKAAVDNVGGYGTMLRTRYWSTPTLQPSMPFITKEAPGKPLKLKTVWTSDGYMLFWQAPKAKSWDTEARRYIVYRFLKSEKINLDDESHIVDITYNTWYSLPYDKGKTKYVYVVTPLNRIDNIGNFAKKKIKL